VKYYLFQTFQCDVSISAAVGSDSGGTSVVQYGPHPPSAAELAAKLAHTHHKLTAAEQKFNISKHDLERYSTGP